MPLHGFRNYSFFQNLALYSFTTATFTPGGATGENGPTITQARAGLGNPTWANTYLNMSNQSGILLWTVPQDGVYTIDAYGARGGTTGDNGVSNLGIFQGGYGARIKGDFTLTKGQVLKLLIGQRGRETTHSQDNRSICSGGGGTFVTTDNNTILVIAGGGGGSSSNSWSTHRGVGGTTGSSGTNSFAGSGTPGTNGSGATASTTGGPAAGFSGDGTLASGAASGEQARSFLNGGKGGRAARSWGGGEVWGGFGGGGGGGGLAGGGGGGYSGGAGGAWSSSQGGGGGGSLNNGSNQTNTSDNRNGDGQIIITKL
jgi:hypothetical protein